MKEYEIVRGEIFRAVSENVKAPEEEVEKAAIAIADAVMDAISENYRSITEIHSIIEAVRAGEKVQIAYYDPEEDDLDGMVVRACW